jgi:DNA-binding transcriptional ArsR family regulator
MVKHYLTLNAVFAALWTRLGGRSSNGERTAGAIAAGFPVSLLAVSKHLKVLERCGLLRRSIVRRQHPLPSRSNCSTADTKPK